MSSRAVLGLVASLMAASSAAAQETQEPPRTTLVLSETAAREIAQDTLVALLTARAEASTPRAAQAEVNQAMTAAIGEAEAVTGVRAATAGYRVYQEHDRDGEPRGWVAEQDLRLTAREAAPLLELAGVLQEDGLLLNGLIYQLSDEARRAIEDELALEAIAALRRRAEEVAASVEMAVETIATLRVGAAADELPIRPMMRSTMAEAAAAPPVALPDIETVSTRVQAELILAPKSP
jgi:predicted secreted protein